MHNFLALVSGSRYEHPELPNGVPFNDIDIVIAEEPLLFFIRRSPRFIVENINDPSFGATKNCFLWGSVREYTRRY